MLTIGIERYFLVEYPERKFALLHLDVHNFHTKIHPENKYYYKLFIQVIIYNKRKILNLNHF